MYRLLIFQLIVKNYKIILFLKKYAVDLAVKEDQMFLVCLILHQSSSTCGQFVKRNSGNFSAVLPVILRSLFFCWWMDWCCSFLKIIFSILAMPHWNAFFSSRPGSCYCLYPLSPCAVFLTSLRPGLMKFFRLGLWAVARLSPESTLEVW